MSSASWPRIVAESLRRLDHPSGVAHPLLVASAEAAALAARHASAPERCTLRPPAILRPDQRDSWRRIMAALRGWNGALLLERVGTGKTWIALAVAAGESVLPVVIVPAILEDQWRKCATLAAVSIRLWTHERCSRGNLPPGEPRLVVIDEAHRFRDPGSRRTSVVAPWLAGRRALLLTATPIVNQIADLVNLLRLVLPDDALALDGVASLGDLAAQAVPPAGLSRVMVRSCVQPTDQVRRAGSTLVPDEAEECRGLAAVEITGRLALSDSAPIRRLIRCVLLDAAASSSAAFHGALSRYHALLLQARDAGGASRAMLRSFAGSALDQLVLWPVLEVDHIGAELPFTDLDLLVPLLRKPAVPEPWISRLRVRCDDEVPTVMFTRHRATAALLRTELGPDTAWVTGSEAGIGPHRVSRPLVLAAFGRERQAWQIRREIPRILVATDVAAEGLDLQAAGRMVHVDLPWTATRVDQREGRLLRIGQERASVAVLVRLPPVAIERALAPSARIRRKRRVAELWMNAVEVDPRSAGTAGCVVSAVRDTGQPAAFVACEFRSGDRTGIRLLAQTSDGEWTGDPALVDAVIERARRAASVPLNPAAAGELIDDSMRSVSAAAVSATTTGVPALVSRVHALARRAAANRDGTTLCALDKVLRFVTASPTLGMRMIHSRLLEASDGEFTRLPLPDIAPSTPVVARVVAAIWINPSIPVYRSLEGRLR